LRRVDRFSEEAKYMKLFSRRTFRLLAPLLAGGALIAAIACGGTDTETIVVQTVIVEKEVAGDTVVQTVVVTEQVKGDTIVQTVEVEKIVTEQIKGETIVQTVIVSRKGETVQVVVTATATAIPTVAGIEPVAPPSPQSGVGAVVIAVGDVGAENGLNQAQSGDNLKNWGMAETLYRRGASDETLPWLGKDWTIADDLGSAFFDVDTTAEFQWYNDSGAVESFGNVSADDVVWSMNNANASTNPTSIHAQAGDFAGLWGPWSVVDADTVSFDFVSFDSTWNADYVNESGQAFSVFSTASIAANGGATANVATGYIEGTDDQIAASTAFARDNIVATGVYLVESWSRDDILVQISTVAAGGNPHWKYTAKTDRVTFIEVPESTTRAAQLKTGEVDIASVEPKDAPQFLQGGFLQTDAGGLEQGGIFFAGNLWEKVSAIDGSPLVRGTYVHDLAWIGNPDDAVDLQEAKSVRNALARAYDRDAINDALTSGLGRRVEVMYLSVDHPRWQSKWDYGYDPDLAIEILRGENSDWPISADGSSNYRQDQVSSSQNEQLNGNSFSLSLYAQGLGGGLALGGEVADAVAGYWADLGLQVFTLKFSYVTFRPTTVGRTNTHPWLTGCDKGKESNPWHFPKGLVQTSLTRGGFGCGFEIPFVLDNYQKVATTADEAVRSELVDQYAQYMFDEALQPGVIAAPGLFIMNPNKLKGWEMGKLGNGNIGRVWEIELK
jgi:ABC-type transport system substrate-binding protein